MGWHCVDGDLSQVDGSWVAERAAAGRADYYERRLKSRRLMTCRELAGSTALAPGDLRRHGERCDLAKLGARVEALSDQATPVQFKLPDGASGRQFVEGMVHAGLLHPGLVIYLLQRGGAYLESATSCAFPSWRAQEIHRALNEQTPSERTYESIRRVGAALGSREGTGPNDDPLLSAYRRQACERGRAGLAEGRVDRVRQILLSRGSEVSEGFAIKAWETWNLPERTLVDAALRCRSEADFRARLAR